MDGATAYVLPEGDVTGAVFCPLRFSHLAVLRCAEYQDRDRCEVGCRTAATKAEIEAVIFNARMGKEDDPGAYTCSRCGKGKARLDIDVCNGCLQLKLAAERREAAQRRHELKGKRSGPMKKNKAKKKKETAGELEAGNVQARRKARLHEDK
jgi:hypothetical protein